MTVTERYVLLGLAPARAAWFRSVGSWANSGALPAEFVKCLSAEEVAARLTPQVVTITAKAGAEGRLFGSVTAADVVAAVESQTGVSLDRRKVHLEEPIKALGRHEVPVRLHSAVELRLAVEVVAAS